MSRGEMPLCALAFSTEPSCAPRCPSGCWQVAVGFLPSGSTCSRRWAPCTWLLIEIALLSMAARLYLVSLAIVCARVLSSSSVLSGLSCTDVGSWAQGCFLLLSQVADSFTFPKHQRVFTCVLGPQVCCLSPQPLEAFVHRGPDSGWISCLSLGRPPPSHMPP